MSRTINLAVIPGDGIGTEVVGEGLKVLDVVAAKYGVTFNKTHYDLGAGYWHRTGEVLQILFWQNLPKQMSFCWALLAIQQFQVEFSNAVYFLNFVLPLITTSICVQQS